MKAEHKTNMLQQDDTRLLELFKNSGNNDVLGILFNRYLHLIYGVCLKYLKNREESKDAVIEIFEKLTIEVSKHEIQNFKSWLYVLTKNYCLMHLRKQHSENKNLQKYFAENFMETTEILHPIDEDQKNSRHEQKLKECLQKLKEEQKLCVELFYYNEKCYQEISEELDMSLKNVKSYIQNGKRNLKICLEN